ncbi:MAG TPA: 50S ribosomal protein L6 [Candidatus Nanoarchaeia archaeon]|nr:50S ribosomal protein L6 [Candidatus Nanoarchaeia archaeon]
MAKNIIQEKVDMPKGVMAQLSDKNLLVKGPKGEVSRIFNNPAITIQISEASIVMSTTKKSKKLKKVTGTMKAHIKNMVRGCALGYTYTLKVCSGHFPMTVAVKNKEFSLKNFFGEKVPRLLTIKDGVTVKIEGEHIIIDGANKETCGQVAADIEMLTRRTSFDRRIFQDGIYITKKNDKEIK